MYYFSQQSKARLETCDVRLQKIFYLVINHFDCSILCGHRTKEEQNFAFANGYSTRQWPDGKHNFDSSLAVDVAPYPINWNDIDRFIYFAGHVKGLAYALDIGLRWGGDWNMNNDLSDEKSLIDLGHFELIELAA